MTFSSLAFLFVFFPIVFLLYFICPNKWVRNVLLILASLFFYAFGEPVAVFIMIISVMFNYFFGLICGEEFWKNSENRLPVHDILRKTALVSAVILNIGLLFVFKYADFFLANIGLKRYSLNLALPIGISFFTFQGLSYVVDVYRDKESVQKNFLSVMLYISFFPQLIAGPIVKYHDIREQLVDREFNVDRIGRGIQRFAFGLGKKVLIAGPMGLVADSIYGMDVAGIGIASAWIAAISYAFQIYFDFSGYSDMAIGLGCIFGFDFKENFNKPYSAVNMQNFWRRWHISLSTWFKEYVYIPMGGNRKGYVRTYLNRFTVFMLTGLWHGANWTFVCWGIMHGLALIAEDLIRRLFNRNKDNKEDKENTEEKKLPILLRIILSFAGHIYTLFFIIISFIVFRADNLTYAMRMIGRLFTGSGSDSIAFSMLTPEYLFAFVLAVVFASTLPDIVITKIKTWILRILSILVYVVSVIMLISGGYNPFIYFRF